MTAAATPTATVATTPTPVPIGPLVITPPHKNFGGVKVGTTGVEHLILFVNPERNTGPLMITSLGLESQMTGEAATGFEIEGLKSSCHVGDSIARGKSCTVYIVFAPPARGPWSDNLVITGDFTNSGYHIALFGLGY
jgi:hypothetical protein